MQMDDVYSRSKAFTSDRDVHDLAGVFDDQTSQVWRDFVHVTPEGNRLLADSMLQSIKVSWRLTKSLVAVPAKTPTNKGHFRWSVGRK